MKIDIVTLFPDFFESPLKTSLIGKANVNKKINLKVYNLRDYSSLPHKQVDDTPYGGGSGMVLKPDILAQAVNGLKKPNSLVILTEPSGKKFNQTHALDLSKKEHLILIAGRYEGVDQRFKDKYVDLELSIGDYILNGGETACLVIIETVARLVEGVLGSSESLVDESFSEKLIDGNKVQLLEYPQYTRPEVFEGLEVPKTLLSGNHQEIAKWRQEQALEKTNRLRPDLLKKN